jgi:hypothetical protein
MSVAMSSALIHFNRPLFCQRLSREIQLWLSLQHDNIVPLLGVADGFSPVPALVSPWFKNGALTGYLLREHKMLSYNRKFGLVRSFLRHTLPAKVALAL